MKLDILRNRQNGHVTPQARPEIAYGDTDLSRIAALTTLLESPTKPCSAKTQYVRVRGHQAVAMAHSIRDVAPSRTSMISAFITWLQAQFTEDRVELAKQVAGRRPLDSVQPGAYTSLSSDPNFVSGVLDSRGRIVALEKPDRNRNSYWISHKVKVNSVNGELLAALQKTHGGQLIQIASQGEAIVIRGKKSTLVHDVFEWILGSHDSQRLIDWAKPKLPLSNRP